VMSSSKTRSKTEKFTFMDATQLRSILSARTTDEPLETSELASFILFTFML
jgi:hypothetical protein